MSGIYLHIPFCRQACTYCDFHFSTNTENVERLIGAIDVELRFRKAYLQNETVETIYFGGGTPSLIDSRLIRSLLQTISNEYNVIRDPEITLEANPDDLSREKTDELIAAGINRLSIGIQSFNDEELKFMNRAHDSKQALSSIENAKRSGFRNLSVDLIYGIPNALPGQWKENVDIALRLDVDHLSCYALTVEDKTLLADMIRKKKIFPADEDKVNADFELLMEMTAKAGFEHYEISNFARNKKYSRHNTSYWEGKKYLGVGPSAHSYDGESRQWNVRNNPQYIRSIDERLIPAEIERLTDNNKFNEYILTSLRTMWGIDISFVEKKFGEVRKSELEKQLGEWINDQMIIKRGENYILTDKGKFFADRIAASLFRL